MHLDRLTDASRSALERAFQRASELRHAAVEPQHLLAALLADDAGTAPSVLGSMGIDVPALRRRVDEELAASPTADHVAPSDQYLSQSLTKVLDRAEADAARRKDRYTSADQLLLALASVDTPARRLLDAAGVRRDMLEPALQGLREAGLGTGF